MAKTFVPRFPKIPDLVPKNIPIAGENTEGVSAFVTKDIGNAAFSMKDGLYVRNSQITTATHITSENNGRNYELMKVKQPRANTLVFRVEDYFDDSFNREYFEGYGVFDGERFGHWAFNDKFKGYDLLTEKLEKDDKFFEIVKVK